MAVAPTRAPPLTTFCRNRRFFARFSRINYCPTLKRSYIVTLIILLVLVIDQALKVYIKTHFEYNQDVQMFGLNWAKLHFVENEGMAFGIIFNWEYGKLLLSTFRILMVAALIWYIRILLRVGAPSGFIYSVGLITAGALGNIIDSAFYGMIFTESPYHGGVAELVSFGQGYGTFLHGKVVDMMYFPIKWITLPEWVPILGGDEFLFFSPIFNIADASISCGVICILLFQRQFFRSELGPKHPGDEDMVIIPGTETMEETSEEPAPENENTFKEGDDTVVTDGAEAPSMVEEDAPAASRTDESEAER